MKKILVILTALLIWSCDDGDIIVTSFDFDEQTLQTCTDFDFVYFKINPDNNETLALQFSTTLPFQTEEGSREISLSSSNQITYRRFNRDITASYFCNAIPPTQPTVVEEFTSNVGDITLVTVGTLDDEDGIPAELEAGMDTDGDGIENDLDFDDDGDNVPTRFEGVVITDGIIDVLLTRDTDGDGTFDYLDTDDDGDGTLTIDEDPNMDLDPMNDNSDPDDDTTDDYLNPDIDTSYDIEAFREHETVFDDIEITITMTNLDFRNENGEEVIRNTTIIQFGVFEGSPPATLITTPEFVMN
ncbi:MAG: hypothetical protein ACI828_002864 [Flavobacteriales bacterium]|jgi:hypothetical protein